MSRIAVVALAFACGCIAMSAEAQKRHMPDCQKGSHVVKTNSGYGCAKDGAPAATPEQKESAAWEQAGNAMKEYNQALGANSLASQNAESAQRQLAAQNCGQFQCDSSELKGRISSANNSMNIAGNNMQNAIASCEAAKKTIEEAHAAGSHVREGLPTCPSQPGSGGGTPCPKGSHMQMGKCVK